MPKECRDGFYAGITGQFAAAASINNMEVYMKKLSLLLALMLTMCSFAACGDSDDEESGEESSSSSRSADDDEEEDDDDDDDDDSAGFARGEVKDDVYTSDFSGVTFEIPEGWDVYSDEEVMDTMSVGLEASGSSMKADAFTQKTVYDCVAGNRLNGECIMILFEDLSKYPESFSKDDYISAAKMSTAVSMPNAEIDWKIDGEKGTLCGMDFDMFGMDMEIPEYNISLTQDYYIKEINGYLLVISYSSGGTGHSMNDYVDCFKG